MEKEIYEDAINIIVKAMCEVEAEGLSNPYWYLDYLKLRRVFQYLCHRKYIESK